MMQFLNVRHNSCVSRECKVSAKKKSRGKGNEGPAPVGNVDQAPVSASMYLQFDALLGNNNPEKTLMQLQQSGKAVSVDADTLAYLSLQEKRATQDLMYSNMAKTAAASNPRMEKAVRILRFLSARTRRNIGVSSAATLVVSLRHLCDRIANELRTAG